jgi:hypothetical protein
MADGVRPVSPVAARGRVAQDPVPVAGPRGRGRSDHVGCVGGLHRRPGPPARRWGAKKGNFKSNRQAEQELPNLTITRWEGSRGGLTTKTHLACEQGQKTLAVVITAGQRGDSPTVHHGARRHQRPPHRTRTPPADTRPRVGRQGLQLQGQPCLPASTRHQGHHPNQDRPRRQPAEEGSRRRTTPNLRTRDLQTTPRRRVRHQPPQTQPRRGHPLRQARRPLRSRRPHSSDQRLAPTRLVKQALARRARAT